MATPAPVIQSADPQCHSPLRKRFTNARIKATTGTPSRIVRPNFRRSAMLGFQLTSANGLIMGASIQFKAVDMLLTGLLLLRWLIGAPQHAILQHQQIHFR